MNYTSAVRFLSNALQNNGFTESHKSKSGSRYFEKLVINDGQSERLKIRVSDHALEPCFNQFTGEITDSHRQPDGVVLDRDGDYNKQQLQTIFENAYGSLISFDAPKAESLASLRRRAVTLARETDYVSTETGDMWYKIWDRHVESYSKSKDREYLQQEIERMETLGVKK